MKRLLLLPLALLLSFTSAAPDRIGERLGKHFLEVLDSVQKEGRFSYQTSARMPDGYIVHFTGREGGLSYVFRHDTAFAASFDLPLSAVDATVQSFADYPSLGPQKWRSPYGILELKLKTGATSARNDKAAHATLMYAWVPQ